MKKCYRCKQLKPKSEFYKDRTKKDGLGSYCKRCRTKECDEYYKKNKKKIIINNKKYHKKLKEKVFEVYGGPVCVCCGEDTIDFLTVDHIAGGGRQHHKQITALGHTLYTWLRKNNFPKGYQILCRNCNWGKHILGICPHQVGKV